MQVKLLAHFEHTENGVQQKKSVLAIPVLLLLAWQDLRAYFKCLFFYRWLPILGNAGHGVHSNQILNHTRRKESNYQRFCPQNYSLSGKSGCFQYYERKKKNLFKKCFTECFKVVCIRIHMYVFMHVHPIRTHISLISTRSFNFVIYFLFSNSSLKNIYG